MTKRVVVVGAGLTGLACAWALRDTCEVVVLEASDRVGGNVRTVREDGFVMDAGPDAWLVSKPEASALAREVGVLDDAIGTRPENRRVYVAWGGRLHAMPEGVVLGVPTRITPMLTTKLFSLRGKLRMGLEPLVPRRRGQGDESVADFIGRRLGREAVTRLAGPLLGGIFAGDPSRISVDAAFPQLVDQEAKYGSLIVAMRATRRRASGGSASAFLSLRSGMSALPEALARLLAEHAGVAGKPRASVRLGARVAKIARSARGLAVLSDGETLDCDAVVLAVSPPACSSLVAGLDARGAEILSAIRCGSSAVVFLAYRREDVAHPLDASGLVVARSGSDANANLTAVTFVTSKWDHRAPEGYVLLRAFLGGAGREVVLTRDAAALVTLARAEIAKVIGRLGEPVLARVFRHDRASPQPDVGHLERMRALGERLARVPGLYVIGNGYGGTGIPDCIKQANAVAKTIAP
jgi:oxygen-dependent protoporphyrinogen oxidase